MRQLHDKQDYYELRPVILIVLGFVGISNSLFNSGTSTMIHFGQVCGVVLLFSAFKILRWRKAYRGKLHL